ncbi:MAG: hypothetical protein AB1805_00680 [Nitrospirota bacterium]
MRLLLAVAVLLSLLSLEYASAEQPMLRKDVTTRLGQLENRIERGRITGELTGNELSRLRTKLEALRYRKSRLERDGMPPQGERDLDTQLYMLERETERMLNNLERK